MEDEPLLETNMRLLRRKTPEYADVMSAIADGGRLGTYLLDRVGQTITCRDSDGNWVHGPEDPWEAARKEAAALVTDEPALYLLVRPGLGYLPLAILEALSRRAEESLIVMVEDRLELARAALARVDWAPLLQSSCTVMLFGRPQAATEGFFSRYPAVSLLPINLVVPPNMETDSEVAALAQRLVAFAERTERALETQIGRTAELVARRRASRAPLRVLLTVPEIGYLAEPIADGFRACGCAVELQGEDMRTSRGLRAHEWLGQIGKFAPDLVLWMNRPELTALASEALRSARVANVHWSVDSPRRMRLSAAELSKVDVHLCFDATYLAAPRDSNGRVARQLSLGAGLEPIPACRPDAVWPERLGPVISFVGSLGEIRVAELREILRRLYPEWLALLDDLANSPADPAEIFERKTGVPYEGAPCLYVDEVRSTRRRLEVLSTLGTPGLRIYGGIEWAQAPRGLARCYDGRAVSYGFELASLYFHSLINVNVFHHQCVDSTNSRIYDVLACGGFLLTEYRPCLEREFDLGRHLVTFSTPEEAREKAEYYLSHPGEREAIARDGQRHVLVRHSFVHRCRRILELTAPFMS
jgi:hypothetical protein